MDKGETIIALMNAAGYDVATLGNHEFDYNMSGCMNILELAEYPYVSANFYRESDGVRGENGSFLQVSGLTYRIDPTVESTVRFDEPDVRTGGPTGEYRVYDVRVYDKETNEWKALDLQATYNLA